ncbi:TetR/AcrR family transcriptional regulator [Mycolicibacterium palauense]|uniref:TetR/AcrR family transcriptional regulator n=1 Tax=Mycolicibacterium palauense TaxID=2034511 RepID=UPI00159B90C6|nr:TetR/AcrR family transcriptional regulator [Mycolicibacterium palauense]
MTGVLAVTSRPQPPRVAERRKPYRGEERRAAILRALEDLLQQRSLEEIGVADISEAAGVKRNTFYFYFANKAVAVAALLSELFGEMFAGAIPFVEHDSDPADSVRIAIDNTVAAWHKHHLLYHAVLDASHSDAAVREFWNKWLSQFIEPVAATIDSERKAGRARPGPNSLSLASALISMNVTFLDSVGRSGFTAEAAEEARQTLFHVWFSALYS